jgi:hypothetical protein
MYKIYNLEDYKRTRNYIENEYEEYKMEEMCKKLEDTKCYHIRIEDDKEYKIYGDLDKEEIDIKQYGRDLIEYINQKYEMDIKEEEFKYTKNNRNNKSYHYAIRGTRMGIREMKELHINFMKELKYKIDTSVYSNHWYRMPNQLKENDETKGIHKIIKGEMVDFIIMDIEDSNKVEKKKEEIEEIKQEKIMEIMNKEEQNNELVLINKMEKSEIYKRIFNECYKKERFNDYNTWITIGMALKNTIIDNEEAFKIFNYFSLHGDNYNGIEETRKKYNTLVIKTDNRGYTIATIYWYALEDNRIKFIEIMNKNKIMIEPDDICRYIKLMAGNKFIYQNIGGKYKIYCYEKGI